MTREEALNLISVEFVDNYGDCNEYMHVEDVEKLIKNIYNDFERRTCENCKYFQEVPLEESCGNDGICTNSVIFTNEVDLDFGCNKWESKK